VKIETIGSSPVTSGTISGTSVAATETGFDGGSFTVRSTQSRPKAMTAIMRAFTLRSDME
jgi:hypothetical protein